MMQRVARVRSRQLSYLFKFCPDHIFVIAEARHFKFRVLIDTLEYDCMHYILLIKDVFGVT